MKKIAVLCIIVFLFCACQYADGEDFKKEVPFKPFEPPIPYETAMSKAESIVQKMSLEEKIEMIGGHSIFFTKGYDKYGIPSLRFSDATQGVSLIDYTDHLERSVAFPAPLALTSTWNTDLSRAYAKSVGEECRAGGIAVLLGPGMNIYRISQCGRNFEYFGEDPYLAARMIENYVVGLQNTGVIATLKHFIANNTDHRRRTSNSVVSERALREIYAPAFEAGIDAGALAVMTAYNQVNGEYCPHSEYVIAKLLREDLGFKWLVMSDWLSIWDAEKALKSGLDLDMPGETEDGIYSEDDPAEYLRREAPRLIEKGKVKEQDIDCMVKNIMATAFAMELDKVTVKDTSFLKNYDRHIEVALNTAREGIVLLKNDNQTLPFKPKKGDTILVTGKYADKLAVGGGAAYVIGFDQIPLLDALKAQCGENVKHIEKPSDEEIANASMIIYSTGTYDSEGSDVPFDLPEEINSAIKKIAKLNPQTVVIMNTGGGKNMSPWNDDVAAILYNWYPGQIGNKALAEILAGVTNPSGKLPITIERDFKDSPGYPYLPEGEELYDDFELDMAMDYPVYDIIYDEGVFVGYRWYERKNIRPLYAFGHGLSYTTFEYSSLKTNAEKYKTDDEVLVKVDVTNTGDVEGKEIVQLYIKDVEAAVERPVKELKGFQKIHLKPAEKKTVYFTLNKRDFAFWDETSSSWKVEPGKFEILVGSSSDKIHQKALISIYYPSAEAIVYPNNDSDLERLAAKEVRRYVYLRTGQLLPVKEVSSIPNNADLILVAEDNNPLVDEVSSLNAPSGGFFIKSESHNGRTILVISGDDAVSTLYGAYRFAEKLDCRFYFHGDVVPDTKIPLSLRGFDEKGQPLTKNGRQWTTRGAQPFQNFPAGAVMWGKDDWKMYVSQLPKMGMNFIGLHTYMYDPEDDHVGDYGPNLNIWIGHEDDLNPDGTVNFAFDATFFHTHQGIIGWGKTDTSDLVGGTSQLFPTDGYPSEIIGESYHKDQAGYTASFNKAAKLFREVFSLANALGVQTATGIEIPVGKDDATDEEPMVNGIPEVLQERLKSHYGLDPFSQQSSAELYKGMYKWLLYNDIPVDYFWIWTTEIWMPWGGAARDKVRIEAAKENIRTAVRVYESMSTKPFKQFAMGGWVFGAQGDPDVFGDVLPDLNAAYSFMNPPYSERGRHMKTEDWIDMVPSGRIKWPFTWFEYDYALEQPSFHMNRVFEDGWNAYEQNADGFIAEFWRTKMIADMFAAYKDITWDYASTDATITHDIPSDRRDRYAKIDAVHLDWAIHEFGPGPAAETIAADFAAFEKRRERRFKNVTDFREGADDIYSQGYITGGDWGSRHKWGPWSEEEPTLQWVDNWNDLRKQVKGAGNLARFDYWHNVLKAYKLMANIASELNQYEAKTQAGNLSEAAEHRSKLARLWEKMMSTQVRRVYDEVDLGVILNLEWRTWRNWIEGLYDARFIEAGGTLPADKDPSQEYTGGKFITCIPLLTRVQPNEEVNIKALIMGNVSKPTLHYRPLGNPSFISMPMTHDARGVYRGTIPGQNDDFEWYVTAESNLGNVIFPATAGAEPAERMYQTVVVTPLNN